eukprot:TRINITY_DN6420_c0_g2_i2.p1 TRINITY_DN6420_c0_g2~~TRINITY_DN6420_c0_g2_i2.p1  ORF type:complete len:252 (-),score=48.89 TRINITY_DN6420_c0_g2_i2:155-910(-)
MMGVDFESQTAGIQRQPLSFGGYVTANVYWRDGGGGEDGAMPVVIWLHPYSYSTGYEAAYQSGNPVESLTKAGYAVIAYDQIGFGSRIRDGGATFYSRHGGSKSLFGQMITDALAAVDLVMCLSSEFRNNASLCGDGAVFVSPYTDLKARVPDLDLTQLVMAGYALGGNVALHAAALDSRVAAVASFAGFTPMRSDTVDKPTLGIRRLYDLHALLPRLGLFRDDPSRIPYDFHEILPVSYTHLTLPTKRIV